MKMKESSTADCARRRVKMNNSIQCRMMDRSVAKLIPLYLTKQKRFLVWVAKPCLPSLLFSPSFHIDLMYPTVSP